MTVRINKCISISSADGIMKVFLPQTPVIEYEGEKQSCEEVDSQPDFNPNTSSSSSPSTSTTKGRQKENQMPNTVDDGNAKLVILSLDFGIKKLIKLLIFVFFLFSSIFQITAHEYNRLLQAEIQLNKYKGLCEKKAKEIKNLQDLVARLKRKELKRNAETENENEESIMADVAQVNKKILV